MIVTNKLPLTIQASKMHGYMCTVVE